MCGRWSALRPSASLATSSARRRRSRRRDLGDLRHRAPEVVARHYPEYQPIVLAARLDDARRDRPRVPTTPAPAVSSDGSHVIASPPRCARSPTGATPAARSPESSARRAITATGRSTCTRRLARPFNSRRLCRCARVHGSEKPVRIEPLPALEGSRHAEICIVGGGFTGMWTALRIKQLEPDRDVVLVEADVCGSGASGRNGGFVLTFCAPLHLTRADMRRHRTARRLAQRVGRRDR